MCLPPAFIFPGRWAAVAGLLTCLCLAEKRPIEFNDISVHSCYHKQATSSPCAISFGSWATQPFDLDVSPQPRLHDDSVSVWWKMNLYIQRIYGEINQYDYGSKPCTPGEHHICTPVSTQIWYDPFDWIVIAMYSTAMPAARKCRKQLVLTTIILIFKKDGIVNSDFCWFTKGWHMGEQNFVDPHFFGIVKFKFLWIHIFLS